MSCFSKVEMSYVIIIYFKIIIQETSGMGLYTMSNRELSRLEIIQKVIKKELKQDIAADLLNLSIRQIQRLRDSCKVEGTLGLISKKRSKPSNNQLSGKLKDEIISIIGSKYIDFGPTLAQEKLLEIHNINVSVETIRKLMMVAGFWLPRSVSRRENCLK